MKYRRAFFVLLLLALLLSISTPAAAESDYSFQLIQETVHVYWKNNGTLSLNYTFVFQNDEDGHPIDYVDVGLPNYYFYETNATADVNGIPCEVSEYDYAGDGYGIAVVLADNAIAPGERGTVHFSIHSIGNVLYEDNDDKDYASGVFSPTWFGKQYTHGKTDLTVIFHLPAGVQPDEPRYHLPSRNWPGEDEPQIGRDANGQITYTWHSADAKGYTQYKFGASFPKKYVPADTVAIPTFWERIGISEDAFFGWLCTGSFFLFFFGMIFISEALNRRRLMKYVPPKIGIEGHGIKRGLTAVEAALLMGEPLDKVLTMILFSVIKKGAATVKKRDPLKLEIADPLPDDLRPYEKEFLAAFAKGVRKSKRAKMLRDMIAKQIDAIEKKMKGFSRKETIRYYKKIMARAWKHVELADTPEVKADKFSEYLEWTMLDPDFEDTSRRVFSGPVIAPTWWGRYDPGVGRGSTSGRAAAPSSGGTRVQLPGSAFAGSVVEGINQIAAGAVGDIKNFTAGVTKKTNPPPVSTGSSGSSGGSSCACACACAGCACACAGGGR